MTDLLQRAIELTFQPLDGGEAILVSELHVEFEAHRDLEKEPSLLSADVYNLRDDTVNEIRKQKDGIVSLKVAYGYSDLQTIFVGDVTNIEQRLEGPDRIMTVEAGDGKRASRVWSRKTFPKKTKLADVIKFLADEAGLSVAKSHINTVLDNAKSRNSNKGFFQIPQDLKHGMHIRGYAVDELHELCNSHQIEFNIQNNELSLSVDEETAGTSPILTPESGLIGSPVIDSESILRASCVLVPGLYPGSLVEVESRYVSGSFRVLVADYTGALFGDDPMTIDIEAKNIETI